MISTVKSLDKNGFAVIIIQNNSNSDDNTAFIELLNKIKGEFNGH